MSVTRANVEAVLVSKYKGLLEAAGLAVTVEGINADLNYPLAVGLAVMGYPTARVDTATSAEIAIVPSTDWQNYLTACSFYTLEAIRGNLNLVDIEVGPRKERLGQLAMQVDRLMSTLESKLGWILNPLDAGHISLDFAEHNE